MNTPQEVVQAASQLPEADRVHVIEMLLESLEPEPAEDQGEIDRAWREEVRERSQQCSRGQVEPVPWKKVQADAERLFDGGD
jgi:hypothetical protein